MRSIWKGSINFGMVSIPAKLYTATDDLKVSFHQYHQPCGNRIKMPKVCPVCDADKTGTEILDREGFPIQKGYELNEEKAVLLQDADFWGLPLASIKQIEIVEFVEAAKIDIRAYDSCYYLTCETPGTKAFLLFLNAMQTAKLVGIAQLARLDKEHLCVVRPFRGIMLLRTLHYADELKPYEELVPKQGAMITERETEMALTLVNAMKTDFDLTKFHDKYREALEKMIEAKISGETVAVPQGKPPVSDVADALMASLKLVGAGKE
jgi:DNA end-binding protein Ku